MDLILSRAFHLPGEEGGVINDTQWGFLVCAWSLPIALYCTNTLIH